MLTKLIWTRARVDWTEDSKFFTAFGDHVLRIPCLKFEDLPCPPELPPGDLIVTSLKSAERIGRAWPALRRICHTFGPMTAEALRSLGHKTIVYPQSSSQEFFAALPRQGKYVYLGPKDPAFDFQASADELGLSLQSIALYRTIMAVDLAAETILELKNAPLTGVVCLASPSAARTFASIFQAQNFAAITIGGTTAKTAIPFGFSSVEILATPSVEGLASAGIAAFEKSWNGVLT